MQNPLRLGIIFLGLAACADEDVVGKGRADTGLVSQDGGFNSPLALKVGWTFDYRATLTRRNGNQEQNSAYNLSLTITAVNDDGPQSTVSARAIGNNTHQQNWEQTAGLDSWVALIGPANAQDTVSSNWSVFDIEIPPSTPSKRPPKILPHPGIFFLDMRNIEDIRNKFNALYPDSGPSSQAPDPANNRTDWVLQLNGRDEELLTFPDAVKKRNMTLEYDARGFLVRINERLGDSFDTLNPNASYTLTLVSDRPID